MWKSSLLISYTDDLTEYCEYHPKQLLIGVCPLCLHHKLLIIQHLRSKDKDNEEEEEEESHHHHHHHTHSHSRNSSNGGLFAIASLLSRFELRSSCRRPSDYRHSCYIASDTHSTCSSLDDSYISIKFEEHGAANATATANASTKSKGLYKQGSLGGRSIRWRKRIGHLLQLLKNKRFNNPNAHLQHDSSFDGRGHVEIVELININ